MQRFGNFQAAGSTPPHHSESERNRLVGLVSSAPDEDWPFHARHFARIASCSVNFLSVMKEHQEPQLLAKVNDKGACSRCLSNTLNRSEQGCRTSSRLRPRLSSAQAWAAPGRFEQPKSTDWPVGLDIGRGYSDFARSLSRLVRRETIGFIPVVGGTLVFL